jgi:hypothetical protein
MTARDVAAGTVLALVGAVALWAASWATGWPA